MSEKTRYGLWGYRLSRISGKAVWEPIVEAKKEGEV